MEIQLREVLALTRRMAEIIAHHSGKSVDQVAADIDRDYFMTPEEAITYGLIDDIIAPRSGLSLSDVEAGPPVAAPADSEPLRN
jgi:ATP-dependent Clp protease protease subunit